MSADGCLVFFGVRFVVGEDETPQLESRSDPRIQIARKVKLKHYWGHFGESGAVGLLFIGEKIAAMGPENLMEFSMNTVDCQNIMQETSRRLVEGGFVEPPRFFVVWEPDL